MPSTLAQVPAAQMGSANRNLRSGRLHYQEHIRAGLSTVGDGGEGKKGKQVRGMKETDQATELAAKRGSPYQRPMTPASSSQASSYLS